MGMERAERPLVAPAASFLTAPAAWFTHLVTTLTSGHRPTYGADEDIAFSDSLERELIRRELHPD
jgi:hypothetical protein